MPSFQIPDEFQGQIYISRYGSKYISKIKHNLITYWRKEEKSKEHGFIPTPECKEREDNGVLLC